MSIRTPKLVNGKIGLSTIPDGISADKTVDGSNNKVFTSAEKTKLAGLSSGSGSGGGASQTDIANAIATEGTQVRNTLLTLFGNVNWKMDTDNVPYFTAITAGTNAGSSGSTGGGSAPGIVYAIAPPSGLTAIAADGTTDDRANLQAALDYVKTTFGGGTVMLPAKTIKCNTGLSIPSGVTLRGVSGKSTLDFSSISTSGGVAISSSGSGTYPLLGVNVKGPNGGDKNTYPSNNCTGVQTSGIGVTVRDVSITGFSVGLDLTLSDSFFFLGDNLSIGNCGVCVDMNQRAEHNGGSVPSENGERMVFQNCAFYNSQVGFDVAGSGIDAFFFGTSFDYLGLHGKIDDGFVHIVGCHVETGYAANNNNWGSMNRYMFDMVNEGRFEISNTRFEVRDSGVYALITPDRGPNNYNSGFVRLDGTNTWYGQLPAETRQFNDRDMLYFPGNSATRIAYSPFASKWSPVRASYVANDGTPEPVGHRARISAMSVSTNAGNPPNYSVTISRDLNSGATAADGWVEVCY